MALSTRGLDRALAGFDMFILHDQPYDMDYVGLALPSIPRTRSAGVPLH
jgi:hypothetical protein